MVPFELSMAMLLARGALYLQDLAEESAPKTSTEDVHNSDADKSAGNASNESQFGDPPPSAPDNSNNLFTLPGIFSFLLGVQNGESDTDPYADQSPHSFETAERHVDDAEKLIAQGRFKEAQPHLYAARGKSFDFAGVLRAEAAQSLGMEDPRTPEQIQEMARHRALDERISKLQKKIEDAEELPEKLKAEIETLRKEVKQAKAKDLFKVATRLSHLERAQTNIDLLNSFKTEMNIEELRDDAKLKIAFGALNASDESLEVEKRKTALVTYNEGLQDAMVIARYAMAEARQFAVLKSLRDKYPATTSIPFHLDYTVANRAIRPYIPKPGQTIAAKSLGPYEPTLDFLENLTIVCVSKRIMRSGSAEEKAMLASVKTVFEHARQARGLGLSTDPLVKEDSVVVLSIDALAKHTDVVQKIYQDQKIDKFLALVSAEEFKSIKDDKGFQQRQAVSESLQLLADCAVLENVDSKTLKSKDLKGFKQNLIKRSKVIRTHFQTEVSRMRALEEHKRPTKHVSDGLSEKGTYIPDTSWVGPLEKAAYNKLQLLDKDIASLNAIDVNDGNANTALLKLSSKMEEGFVHSLLDNQIERAAAVDSERGDIAGLRQRLNSIDSEQKPDVSARVKAYKEVLTELDTATLSRTVDARIKMYAELKQPSALVDRSVDNTYWVASLGHESPLLNNAVSYDLLIEKYQNVQKLIEQGKIDEARKTFVGLEQAQIGPKLQKLSESDADFNLYAVTTGTIIAAGFGAHVIAESLFVEGGIGFYLAMGHAFAASMKGINALVYEDFKYIYNTDKSALTNAYLFEKQALVDTGMFAFLGVANKTFMRSFERLILRTARRQLVTEGTLKAGQRIIMGSEEEAALLQRAAVIRGHWATGALRVGGAGTTEFGAFGGWDFLSQGFDPHTLSWEAWKHRAHFLGFLKASGALAAPLTKPLHETSRRLALARHRPKIERLNREVNAATAELERSMKNNPNDPAVFKAYRKALEARIAFMDSIPALRNPETYALNKLRLSELSKLESDSQTHQKIFGEGNQFGAEATGPNSGRVNPAKAQAFAKALGEHPHVTDVKVADNGLITFKYEGEEIRFVPEARDSKSDSQIPGKVETKANLPGDAYAAPETTVAIRHDRVHMDGWRPVEPPKDLPLKIQKLGEFIEENPNAPGVDRVTRLYNEAKRQYDALKDRGVLNNPNSDTIYQLFDINQLLNQAIKIQQAARPAGGEEGDTVVMSNPDVGDTVVMHAPDVKNSDVRDAQPDSAPKSSGTRRIQDQETQHNTDTPDEAKAVAGDTVVMDVPTLELRKPVNHGVQGKSKVRGSTGKSEKGVPKTEVDPETVKPDSELAKDIEEIESSYSGLKGKLRAEDFEWDENGFYVLKPSAERTRQLIDILRENLSDVFPELSISPDMDEATVASRLRTFLENYRAAEKVIAGEDLTHCGWSSTLVNNILLAKGFEPFMVSVHQVNFRGKNNPMTELLMRISAKLRRRPDYIRWIFEEFREDMTLTEFKDLLKDEVDSVTGDTITNVGEGADISAAYKEMKNTTSDQRDAVANLNVGGWGHTISAVRIGSKYYLIDINGEQFGKELDKLRLIPEEDASKHGIMLEKPLEQSKQDQEIWDAFRPFLSGIAKNQRDIQRQMRAQEAHSNDPAPMSEPKATEPQPDTPRVHSSFRDPSDALLYECQDTYQSILDVKQSFNKYPHLLNDPSVMGLYLLASKRLRSIDPDRLSDPEYVNKALLTDLIQTEMLFNKAFEAAGKVIESQNQQAQKPYRRKTVKGDLAHDKTSEADNAQDYSAPSEPDTQEVIPSVGPAAMSGDQLKAAGYGLDSSKAANDAVPESGEKPIAKRADNSKQKSPQSMDAENTLVSRVEDPVPLKPPRPSPTNSKETKNKSSAPESPKPSRSSETKQYTSEDTLVSEQDGKGLKPLWQGVQIKQSSELADDPNHVPLSREHSPHQAFDESMLYDFLDRFSEGTEARKKLDSAANGNGELRDTARTFLAQLETLKSYVEQYKKTCELLDKDPANYGKLELARKDLRQAVEKKQQAEEYYRKNFGSENAPETEEAKSVPISLRKPAPSKPISLRKPAPSEPISLRDPKSATESADVERYGIEPLESEPRLLRDLQVPEGTQARDFLEKSLRKIVSEDEWDSISLLFLADTSDARAHIQAIRAEVASEAEASGGYKSIRELGPIIRRALANRGIKLEDIYTRGLEACVSGQIDEATLESVNQSIAILGSLSNQFLPDDVPLYRSVSADAVRLEPDGTYSMASNRHGMSFWGIGVEGREVAEQYARAAHDPKIIFIKTTVGDLRQQGVFTDDLKARVGNSLDFYHTHRGNSGTPKWSRIPVEVVADVKADHGQPTSDKASMPDSAPISAATRDVKPEAMEPLSGEEPTGVRQVNAKAARFSPEVAKDDYEWILSRQHVLTGFLDRSKDSNTPGAKKVRQPYDEAAKLLGELSSSTDMTDPASWDAEVGSKLNKIKELYHEASKAVSQHMVRIIECDQVINGDLGRYQGQDKVEPFFGDSKSKQEAAEFNDGLKALRAKVENYRKLFDKMSNDPENEALRKQVAEKQQDILEDIIVLENSPYYKMEEVFYKEHKKLSDKLIPLSTALTGAHSESPFLARGKREVRYDFRTIPVKKLARYYTPEGFEEIPLETAVKVGVDVSSPEQIGEVETRMKGQGIKVIGRSEVKDINTGRLVGNRLTVKLPTGDTIVVNVHIDPAELGEVAAFLGRYEGGNEENVLDSFAADVFSGNQQAHQEAMAFRLGLNALRNEFLAYEQYRRALRRNPNSSKSEEWEQQASKMLEGAKRRMRKLKQSKYQRIERDFNQRLETELAEVKEVIAKLPNSEFHTNIGNPEALVRHFYSKGLKGLPPDGRVSIEVEVPSEADAQALRSKLKVNQADSVELPNGGKVMIDIKINRLRLDESVNW